MGNLTEWSVRPIAGSFGAEIIGANLAKPLTNEQLDHLGQLLAKYLVVVYRDQRLNIKLFEQFAEQLGPFGDTPFVTPIKDHDNVLAVIREANEKGDLFGGAWHSDWSFQPNPPSYTLLYGREVPEVGGDTVFTNQYLAYEALSPRLQRTLEGLYGIHSAAPSYGPQGTFGQQNPKRTMDIQGSDEALKTQIHPIVRTHPDTGKKLLFINDVYTIGIESMTAEESDMILKPLLAHCRKIQFTCRVRWTPGSLVIWDNRSTQHHAIDDYAGSRREMYRITIAGEKPQ